jgi:hypothetical protein
MQYTVTFCVFDGTAGANPLWHGSFFLSKLDESKKMLEVVETWGFYGLTSTGDKQSYLEQFKRENKMDVDFLPGNHGMLIHEEVRFMDLGHGLHGYTFELTEDKFKELQKRCKDRADDQWQAIQEIVGDGTQFPTDPTRKGRIYPQEAYAKEIFKIEQTKAKINGQPSRLMPFDLFNLQKSNNCKAAAISLLEGILTEEQLAPFKRTGIPRLIRGLESICLHSSGPLREHSKDSGQKVYFRDMKDKEVKLYWTVPPQHIDGLSADTNNLCIIDGQYIKKIRQLAQQLQNVEWFIRNASLPEKYQESKEKLIQTIVAAYQEFSLIEPREEIKKSKWMNFGFSLFAVPRNKEEKKIQDKINQAEELLNSLYMAIVDAWEMEDQALADAEALVTYLSERDQQKLCDIIGRNYVKDEEVQLKFY